MLVKLTTDLAFDNAKEQSYEMNLVLKKSLKSS
jgi:hypothetical protein